MNNAELKIRYLSKIKYWYKRFIELSDITDKLQAELERQKEIIEKVVNENTQLVIELKKLQEEQTEMSFSNIELGQ